MALVVGLTGGIASGKSTVSNMIKNLGITVIDADVEARLAVEKGKKAYHEIVSHFGPEILQSDGTIDRAKLGSIVFHNSEKRMLLNTIVHPAVREQMLSKKIDAEARGEKMIVMDIPLLFESELTNMVDKTLLVYVDEEIQLKRLMERNHFTEQEAKARINSQMPLKEKISLADAVIDNNGTIEETRKQLMRILSEWGYTE
ncbi:dephospho-CoA kinase [Bacillus methanolicus]|uniref:dephospho-CoA kinase n=1 Tax=Bacillus methanolicus TaxID=1471 RepID=UPI002380A608|nr:dephospho-CoA kinase [Bacillus methanolicus]MDE3839870.1 dephospho-CoA kinase [Bacillus methanolicus]